MKTGLMPHRVTLQQPVTAADEFGQAVESWQDLAQRFASVEGLSGRELLLAQQVASEATKKVRVWGADLAGLDTTCRVVWAGGTLLIEAVIDKDGKRTELELLCKETK